MSVAETVPNNYSPLEKHWTIRRVIAVVVVLAIVASTVVGGLFYYRGLQLQPRKVISGTCNNRATNFPVCDVFRTLTGITCSPDTIESYNLTSTSCNVEVTPSLGGTLPTGNVSLSVTGSYKWHADPLPCVLTPSSNHSNCHIVIETSGPNGTMTVSALYTGDAFHQASSGSFMLDVVNPPTRVTVSGIVTANDCGLCFPLTLTFKNSDSAQSFSTSLNGGYSSSYNYTITLDNLENYSIELTYLDISNPVLGGTQYTISCSQTLALSSASTTIVENFTC